jgi:class 3 adenylate cyclase/streptogramin lyase
VSSAQVGGNVWAVERYCAMPQDSGRRLATVLFLDIVGSTAIASDLGDRRWRELLTRFRRTVRAELKRHGGREEDTAGDGFFATFAQPDSAIRGAGAIVAAVHDLGLEVRCGLHTGGVETIDGSLGGIAVHIAARVMSLANSTEVLVSSTVRDLVAGSKIEFEDFSAHELKGVPGTWQIFAVTEIDGKALARPLDAAEASARIASAPAALSRRRRHRIVAIGSAAVILVTVLGLILANVAGGGPPTTLVRIDPATGHIVTTLHDGAYSEHLWGVLQAAGGSLWQATQKELVRRDIRTGQIEGTIPLPDGLGLATGGAGSVFVAPKQSGTQTVVTRYDETSGRRLGQLRINQEIADLQFGNGALWALAKDGTLTKIDPLRFRVIATYDTKTSSPGVVVPLAGYVWICECEAGKVIQFDPRSERVIRTLPLAQHGFLFGVADTNGETHVWLLDPGASTLTPIDPKTGVEGRSIGVPAQISDAEIALGSIWVSSPAEIRRIDLSTSRSRPPIEMPADVSAGSIAVDPATGTIWVANCGCPKQQS